MLLQKEIGEISAEKRVLETTLQQRVAQITEVQAKCTAAERSRADLEQRLHSVTAKYEEVSKTYRSLKTTVSTQSHGDVKRIKQLEVRFTTFDVSPRTGDFSEATKSPHHRKFHQFLPYE